MNKKNIFKIIKDNKYLLLIFSLGLLLRLVGIGHGSPYVTNIDEPTVVKTAFSLIYNQPISRFDWPHFNFYFNFLAFELFIKGRGLIGSIEFLKQFTDSVVPILWNDAFIFYIVSRVANAILSALTIIPIYLLSEKVFNEKVAIISSSVFLLLPYHIFISHYTIQDGPMLFWLSIFIYYAYLLSVEKNNYFKNLILSAITLGIASSYKYNASLFGVFIPLFYLVKIKNKKEIGSLLKSSILVGIFSFIIFSIVNYRIYLDWKDFWSYKGGIGFLWQLKENSQALSFNNYLVGIKVHFMNLFNNVSASVYILFLITPFLNVKKKLKKENSYALLFFLFALLFFLFMSRYGRAGDRYFLPIYGLISAVASLTFLQLYQRIKLIQLKYVFISLIFIPLIISSFNMMLKFINKTTYNVAFDKYYKEGNKPYYLGEDISTFDYLNNLGLKKFKEEDDVHDSTYILSGKRINNIGTITEVDIISNKNRLGSNIYIYEAN